VVSARYASSARRLGCLASASFLLDLVATGQLGAQVAQGVIHGVVTILLAGCGHQQRMGVHGPACRRPEPAELGR